MLSAKDNETLSKVEYKSIHYEVHIWGRNRMPPGARIDVPKDGPMDKFLVVLQMNLLAAAKLISYDVGGVEVHFNDGRKVVWEDQKALDALKTQTIEQAGLWSADVKRLIAHF